MSVELVFETHATSEDNERGLATGWKPGHLSAAGREQARELGLRRADDGISVIFTSDLSRALETVGIAFGESRTPVLHDWRLRECNYGAMNGSPAAELRRREHLAVPYPTGESWRGAVARVARFLDDLGSTWFGDRVLVVGHTATWFALEHHLHDAPLEDLLDGPFSWQAGWEYRVTLR
ncbi:MAG: histidine phosphatase family protein [Actinomycetota bacterium]